MEAISIGVVNSCFVTELRGGDGGQNEEGDRGQEGAGLVHTHKIVRGQVSGEHSIGFLQLSFF